MHRIKNNKHTLDRVIYVKTQIGKKPQAIMYSTSIGMLVYTTSITQLQD